MPLFFDRCWAEDRLFDRVAAFTPLAADTPHQWGPTKVQLVYVGDVAATIVAACARLAKPGTTYELGGADIISYRKLADHGWSGRAAAAGMCRYRTG
jgi:uncharacterized protein YbjT (DUF2867 family)